MNVRKLISACLSAVCLGLLFGLLSGCTERGLERGLAEGSGEEIRFPVRVTIRGAGTKGSSGADGERMTIRGAGRSLGVRGQEEMNVQEGAIHDLNVYAYRTDGALAASDYISAEGSGAQTVNLILNKGQEYRFYALANVGIITPPAEESMLAGMTARLRSIEGLNENIPFVHSAEQNVTVNGDAGITLELESLIAKIEFQLDLSQLIHADMKVHYIKLRSCNRRLSPFASEGSRALSTGDIMTRVYIDEEGIEQLNNGGRITLYVPENMQGTLLPGNTDPWKKTPEMLQNAETCTYMEVHGTYIFDGAEMGEVSYRFYIGADNTSNFDIERGKCYHATLELTPKGAYTEGNWKLQRTFTWPERHISFGEDGDFILYRGEESFITVYGSEGITVDIFVDEQELETAGVSMKVFKNPFSGLTRASCKTSASATLGARIKVKAVTWDKMQSDSLYLVVHDR